MARFLIHSLLQNPRRLRGVRAARGAPWVLEVEWEVPQVVLEEGVLQVVLEEGVLERVLEEEVLVEVRARRGVPRGFWRYARGGASPGGSGGGKEGRRAKEALEAARLKIEEDLAGCSLAPFWPFGVYWESPTQRPAVGAKTGTHSAPSGTFSLRRSRFPYIKTPAISQQGNSSRESKWRVREPDGAGLAAAGLLDALRRGSASAAGARGAGGAGGGGSWLHQGGVERYVRGVHAAVSTSLGGAAMTPAL
ncbi:hypothetical protein T484DRAFT_1782567 [Baffinella frigidus]|nr:hypothetical protein T484DRAFT_1782567 [Cryptophyta sp. CCMP2293]